ALRQPRQRPAADPAAVGLRLPQRDVHPKAKRQYGYYLLPIVHEDRLVGRISPRVERKRDTLVVEGIYLEPEVKPTAALRRAVVGQLEELAAFRGVHGIEYGEVLPDGWRAALLSS